MILAVHIVIAVLSILYTSYLFFFPTQTGLKVAQLLVLLTLASGTYLVVIMPANMTQTCLTGLTYLAIVSVGLLATRHKLAAVKSK